MKKIYLVNLILIASLHVSAVFHKVNELTTADNYPEIAVYEDLLFVNDENNGLMIYEISNPTFPSHISTIEIFDNIRESVFREGLAYFLSYNSKLYIVDILDPFTPQIISEYDTIDNCYDLYLNNYFAYIIEDDETVEVVFIGDPSYPQFCAEFILHNQGISCAITNDLAFIATYSGLFVYDISNPYEMNEVNWFDTGNTHALSIKDERLYFSCSDGFEILDFSNPEEMQIIYENDNYHFYDSVIVDDMFYTMYDEVKVFNIFNILFPIFIDEYIPNKSSSKLDAKDDIVYINSISGGVSVLDCSQPHNDILISHQSLHSNWLEKSPDSQYMAIYGRANPGLHFYWMNNPINPEYLYTHYWGNGVGCDAFYIDEDICCSSFSNRLYIYDLTNHNELTVLSMTELSQDYEYFYIRAITRKDSLLYLASDDNELLIYDISDITDPQEIANYDMETWMFDLTVKDDFLYFVNINGLSIYTLSDPLCPVEVGFWDSYHRAEQFAILEDIVYVADYDGGIKVIDVSESSDPILVNTLVSHNTSRFDNDLLIRDNKLFVSDKVWNEIFVYDLDTPSNPMLLFSYSWNHYSNDLEIFGDYIYSANGSTYSYDNFGLSLLDFSHFFTNAENPQVNDSIPLISDLLNYPNPFNSSTIISFYLNEPQSVSIEVYNLKGQRMKSLVQGIFSSGIQTVEWDGKDNAGKAVSSGVYIYNLLIDDKHKASKKCILLK